MTVAELIVELQKCEPGRNVHLLTIGDYGELCEVRQCRPNGRCDESYVELSLADVPTEWLAPAARSGKCTTPRGCEHGKELKPFAREL